MQAVRVVISYQRQYSGEGGGAYDNELLTGAGRWHQQLWWWLTAGGRSQWRRWWAHLWTGKPIDQSINHQRPQPGMQATRVPDRHVKSYSVRRVPQCLYRYPSTISPCLSIIIVHLVSTAYRVAPKSKSLTSVYIFAYHWSILIFFTGTFCGKFVIRLLLNTPPHFNCAAALLCEI